MQQHRSRAFWFIAPSILVLLLIVCFVPTTSPFASTPALASLSTPTVPAKPTTAPTDRPNSTTVPTDPSKPTAVPTDPSKPTAVPTDPSKPTAVPTTRPGETPKPTDGTVPEATPRPTSRPHKTHDETIPTPSPVPTAAPTETPAPEPQGDVTIVKTVDQAKRLPGEAVVYTVVIHNSGPATAHNVVVTDNVPKELQVTDLHSTKGDVVVKGQTVTGYPAVLGPDESATIQITAKVRPGTGAGIYTNIAVVTLTEPGDNPNNNRSTVDITVGTPVKPHPNPKPVTPPHLPNTASGDNSMLATVSPVTFVIIIGVLLLALGASLHWSAIHKGSHSLAFASVPALSHVQPMREPKHARTQTTTRERAAASNTTPVKPTRGPALPNIPPAAPLPPPVHLDRTTNLSYVHDQRD